MTIYPGFDARLQPDRADPVHRPADPARLAEVRARRHHLIGERERCEYLLRLVNAELDLLVAATVPGVVNAPFEAVGVLAPPMTDLGRLIARPDLDRAERLQQLQEAQRQLAHCREALDASCAELTTELIEELVPNPRACL